MRKMIELAVAAGRKLQNAQTGLLHYNEHIHDEPIVTIPIIENFLFSLALFRTKTAENIAEAKSITERLLHFQNSTTGNFPIFLHEYPVCHDWYRGFSLFVPFYWMLKEFQSVLGQELKNKIEATYLSLLQYGENILKEKPAPFVISLKFAAGARAFGKLFNQLEWIEKGDHLLHQLASENEEYWRCPSTTGEMLTSLRIAYESLIETPWQPFWTHIATSWNSNLCTFPDKPHKQLRYEPKATLADLYLGSLTQTLSQRAQESTPLHLEGALIYPFKEELNNTNSSSAPFSLSQDKLQLMWGCPERLHTFCYDQTLVEKTTQTVDGNNINLYFDLKQEIPPESKEESREICFFLDLSPLHQIFIEETTATTFALGDKVTVKSRNLDFSLKFHLEEGQGRFIGHVMKGNRPNQTGLKGKNRYQAYDWQIFLRTITRQPTCRIRAELSLSPHA